MPDIQRCNEDSLNSKAINVNSSEAVVSAGHAPRRRGSHKPLIVAIAALLVVLLAVGGFVAKDTIESALQGDKLTHSRVSSHDPSVVKANGKYYIFGTHRAFAKSDDLQHWSYFSNNLTQDYETLLGPIWNAWPKQPSNPDVRGNMWAPEVIWNKTMRKWCMYLSANGDNYKSVIVLLTADNIEGDWTYVGPVVFSGFGNGDADKTDVPRVLGSGADLTRYFDTQDTEINAIDACVKYDGDDMWMAFGSWFGGIWMLKLDPSTGLRDYKTTYPTKENVSDAYYGHKLAGGHGNSGEGTALVKNGEYWYMMLSYGALQQGGGYQMREFRSKSITGPYLDQNGNAAIYTRHVDTNLAFNRGLRIDSSYSEPGMQTVLAAQGGNSLLKDSDGIIYNVYHTRFVRDSGDKEEHQVRVTPMVDANGWLVMAPYEKSGQLLGKPGYTTGQIKGRYGFVVHNPTTFYSGGDASSKAVYQAQTVELKGDGSLSGEGVSGSWSVDGTEVSLDVATAPAQSHLHGKYKARVNEQYDETGRKRLFFTGLGGDAFRNAGPDAKQHGGETAFWAVRE
ncbi:endo-1,5-alpha-L-arabinosidase [Bifidobacterium bombi DSM 19703]|uniref:Endo-1,5-alpha-L-arabinosidase n=1 Tax=Bifidobacterium bombi DSM 19703 TaxID=1341695 RepID=A0A080N379_9BIFI|nr:endo-1,5-alpha-L-arabinosidase [Bifidobacterium bombi DSM 19703]